MKITLNNTPEEFPVQSLTVSALLQAKKYTFKMLVIKVNGKLVPRGDYEQTYIGEGDDVMVLHLISGG